MITAFKQNHPSLVKICHITSNIIMTLIYILSISGIVMSLRNAHSVSFFKLAMICMTGLIIIGGGINMWLPSIKNHIKDHIINYVSSYTDGNKYRTHKIMAIAMTIGMILMCVIMLLGAWSFYKLSMAETLYNLK